MKKFLIAFLIALTATAVTISDADARRLGGGRSFGRQSQGFSRPAPSQSPSQFSSPSQARPAAPPSSPTMPARRASPWRNILGGALLGLGLGALLSHFGLGGLAAGVISTMLTFALIAFVIMLLVRLFRGKGNGNGGPARHAYAGAVSEARTPEIGSRIEPRMQQAAFEIEPALGGSAPRALPAGFDADAFLRHAKTYFIRLQAAWDKADINDIREFTSPEMFGELRLQLHERGASPNHTDVVALNAELLDIEKTGDEYLASVKFGGMIKEAENAPAEPFAEIWNLTKPISGQGGWVLAGIQQLS